MLANLTTALGLELTIICKSSSIDVRLGVAVYGPMPISPTPEAMILAALRLGLFFVGQPSPIHVSLRITISGPVASSPTPEAVILVVVRLRPIVSIAMQSRAIRVS